MTKTFVIPDVHGRYDLLCIALDKINLTATLADKLIFLGDYIDWGPQSAQAVKVVRDGLDAGLPWIALKGNHEDFMATGLVDGDSQMLLSWMQNGGRETMQSYTAQARDIGNDAEWMKQLPVFYEDQHRVYVHAFAPEQYDMKDAPQGDVLWTRYPEGADVGYRGKHVVHGHNPCKTGPELFTNRTNFNCGAVFWHRLVVGVFDDEIGGGPVELIEVVI
jgi:serine/threonine protein phosphatase 1